MFIVALNAVVGVIQESKAEQALAALKKMAAPNAMVLRDGHQIQVPSRELVVGDIVLLEAGNFVPADLRLVQTVNLKIEEASLTGESVPVEKNATVVLDKDVPLGDRTNSAFMGTVVTYGRGSGLVAATGMNTQIGLIAQMLQSFEDEDTPLQRKLADLGKVLGTACLAICVVVFVYGLFRDTHLAQAFDGGFLSYLETEKKDIVNLFMVAVSLAIAAVPGRAAGHRDDLPGAGHAAHDQAPRADPQTAGRRDARLRHRRVFGQDRHADAERDDRGAGLDRWTAHAHHRRRLRAHRPVLRRAPPVRPARPCRRAAPAAKARCCAMTRAWKKALAPMALSRGISSAIRPKRRWRLPR